MTGTVFVTGAAGFIGLRVARQLRERGDRVVAVVRDPATATDLRAIGAQLIAGNLDADIAVRTAMDGCDSVIHLAGRYEIGIPESERSAMFDTNVTVMERVIDAAIALGIPRIVDISTANTFGDTHGRIVDETFERHVPDGFLSYYDETKYLAEQAAVRRIAAGTPLVIVQPGTVYGRNDHSAASAQLKAAFDGTAAFVALGGVGVSPSYVDDLASGIVAAHDRGRIGESYVMAGQNIRLREAMEICARAGGHRLPRMSIPDGVLRLGARLTPGGGGMFGLPPNLTEILRASAGVTYWASSAKAAAELGYSTRDLAVGAVDAFGPTRRT